MSLVCKNKKY